MCETKNNEWKRCWLSIQEGIDNCVKTTRIKPNFANLNRHHCYFVTYIVHIYSKKYYPQNWLQKQGVCPESVTFFCLNKGSLQNFGKR